MHPAALSVDVAPARRVRGSVRVPGDKSISHRYALLSALAEGTSRLSNYAPGADCASTLRCLAALGVDVHREGDRVRIEGRGLRGLAASDGVLDAGNSGSTVRMMSGIVAAHPFRTRFDGDASLRRRPMRRVAAPLELMGARVETTDGRLPLTIHGAALTAIDYRPEVPSAQVKSAVLLAGLQIDGTTTVIETSPTRDHTERAVHAFGGRLRSSPGVASVEGGVRLQAQTLRVPGDMSSAAFWAVAAAALPQSEIQIEDVGLNPSRVAILDVLRRAGAHVVLEQSDAGGGEPLGRLTVAHGALGPLVIAPDEVPGVIDELPVLAALATFGGALRVTGAGELRTKESDRITALVRGLRALGAAADELPDGFVIDGSTRLTGGTADAVGDHRLAMAFAIAALGASAPSTVLGAEAVDVSYPGFFDVLPTLCE